MNHRYSQGRCQEMMHLLDDVLTDAWKELRKDDPAWLVDPMGTGDPMDPGVALKFKGIP